MDNSCEFNVFSLEEGTVCFWGIFEVYRVFMLRALNIELFVKYFLIWREKE